MEGFCEYLKISIPPFITLRQAMLVTSPSSQQESLTISELPWYMLSRIMKLDSNNRLYPNILFAGNEEIEPTSTFDLFTQKIEETQSTNIHPMDIFIFLFIRSHPIFRQTLIAQISKCQLSIPLIRLDPHLQRSLSVLIHCCIFISLIYTDNVSSIKIALS